MPVSKAQQRAVNKYMSENYDRINLTVPKGQKEIIKAHGEQITLTSEEGKGSEFIFSLPKEKDMLVPIKPVHIESRNEGYSEADTSSPSIKSNGKFRIKDS